uniref:Uncharacterized protein n=1 Tax=Tanacetum cinerariifolium TaxID=118510 RepID=A0A699J550_TANCI|nr:hypothetical protein [Tanacetum cinerariifolium]
MNNKKRIVNLEYFREMLHICPRIPNQTFDELSFEEEILAFLRYLGHSGEIKNITDININKLHQPWRSFVVVINKCLSGKSTGYDSLRFTKVIINFFMTKNPLIPRRNKFDAMLLVKLTNEVIKNYAAYKEFYVISGTAPPKMKASVRKTQSSFDTTMPPSTPTGTRLSTIAKGKQHAKLSKAKGLSVIFKVALTKAEQIKLATKRSLQQTHISQVSVSGTNEETGIIPGVLDVPTDDSDEEISWKSSDEDDDDDVDDQSEANDNDDDQVDEDEHDDDDQDLDNDGDDFVYLKFNDDKSHGMNVGGDEGPDAEDDDEELYRDVNINLEGRDVRMTGVHTTQVLEDTRVTLTPVNPDGQQQSLSVSSQFVTSMFNPSHDAGIDSLFESTPQVDVTVMTTIVPPLVTAPTLPLPSIPIMSQVQQEPAPTLTTAPSSSLQDLLNFGSFFGFDHHLKTLEANFSLFMQTNQFAGASDKLRDETQAENEDFINKLDDNIQKIIKEQVKTSYVVAADLSEQELKQILIEKMESNKSIHRSDEQRNIYKALVDAYEYEEPFAGSDRGSKRRREGKEPESTSAPKEKASKTTSESTKGSKSHQKTASESAPKQTRPPTPDRAWNKTLSATYGSIQPWISDLAKQGHRVIPFDHFINNNLEYLRGGASSCKYTTSVTKTKATDYGHISGLKTWESARDVYSKRRIIAVIEHQIDEWHDYKHLDWITVRRDDDKLYKFKEVDFKRLRIQDIEDMLLLLVSKVTKRSSTFTKPDTYRTDLKRKEAYTAYSNPRGIIYQNKDKQNRLIWIDELQKFNDGTLNDVRTALDDRLKGIRMKYLP